MKKLSLTFKIIIIFLIPTLTLVYFSFYFVEMKYTNLNESAKNRLAANITNSLSKLIHNIQLERGLSAGLIVAKYKIKLTASLHNQYLLTDKAYTDFLKYIQVTSKTKKLISQEIDYKNKALVKNIIFELSNIKSTRDKVLTSKLGFNDEVMYYSNINKDLIHLMKAFIVILNKVSGDNLSLSKLQYLKEYAGLERAYIYNQLLQDLNNQNNISTIKTLQANQIEYKKEFMMNSSIESTLIFSDIAQNNLLIPLENIREEFSNNFLTDKDATRWFKISTQRINKLEEISTKILTGYIKQASTTHTNALNALYLTAVLWVLFLISLSILTYIIRNLMINEERYMEELRISSYTFDSHEAITITDVNGIILKVNNAFTRITGYTPKDVIGQNPRVLKSMKHSEEFYKDMWHKLHTQGKWSDEIYNMRKNGEVYLERLSITAIKNKKDITTHYIAHFLDISDLKQAQESAEHQAEHDFLTGLANRKNLMQRLNEEFIKARRHNFLHAFLFIDLDNFKKINDHYGHAVGDLLLKEVAKLLQTLVREEDFVARISGDEFAIMLLNINNEETEAARNVEEICKKILKQISKPFIINEYKLEISSSVGIKLFPDGEQNTQNIIIHADTAMYQAKTQGKNQFVFFDKGIELELKQLRILEEEIKHSLKNDRFKFFFQPKVDIQTGKISGAELLVRWQHPSKGLLYPSMFIELSSDIGLLGDFTMLALHSACNFLKKHHSSINGSLSINIRSNELLDPQFEKNIIDTVQQYNIDPSKLELEITENELIKDFDLAVSKIAQLQKFGINFSIDDFGTGYSSITYLKKLPVNTLKIDRSFLQNLEYKENEELLNMMIQMAHTFNMHVVVEGVENISQLNLVSQQSAEFYQGFYFSEAIPQEEFIHLIKETNH